MAAIDFGPAWLLARLRALGVPRGAGVCVAFSGGIDSTALLLALTRLPAHERPALRALHVDHGLRAASAADAEAARAQARALAVDCDVLAVRVEAQGRSLEAAARSARYAALAAALRPGEALLSAHHQDDQLETLLLMLMRGSGVAGLAAMSERSVVCGVRLLRPLLPVPRVALEDYVRAAGLRWVEDDSNADLRFDRNFLRQRITPLLRERWPAAPATASRSAGLLAEAQGLLDEAAEAQWRVAADGETLRVSALRALRPAARANLVRWWLRRRGLPLPEQARLREICGRLLMARGDAQPELHWDGAELHRHDGRLFAFAPLAPPPTGATVWHWRRAPQLHIPGAGILELRRDPRGELDLRGLPRTLEVRFRSGGERLRGVRQGQALKEWLRSQRLAPWERARLPLIHADGHLIAVADRWLAPQVLAQAPRARRARLVWRWQ